MSKGIYGFTILVILMALTIGSMAAAVQPQKSVQNRYQVNASKGTSPMSLLSMAKAFLRDQQSRTSSEVLTLNITNLIILIVVKAIIFGFGFLGGGFGRSSSLPLESLFGQADLMMMMGYALASSTDDYDCLYRTACDEPETASQYMTASKILLKGAKLFKRYV
jgi:hypothetical protein